MNKKELKTAFDGWDDDDKKEFLRDLKDSLLVDAIEAKYEGETTKGKTSLIHCFKNETLIAFIEDTPFDKYEKFQIARDLEIDLPFLCLAETMQQTDNLRTLEDNFERIPQNEFEAFLDKYKL